MNNATRLMVQIGFREAVQRADRAEDECRRLRGQLVRAVEALRSLTAVIDFDTDGKLEVDEAGIYAAWEYALNIASDITAA